MSLTDKLWGLIEACSDRMNDWDARSALGMADSFRRGGNVDLANVRVENGVALNRDGLASLLIEAMLADKLSDHKAALAEARRRLNAPHANEPEIQAFREKQKARMLSVV